MRSSASDVGRRRENAELATGHDLQAQRLWTRFAASLTFSPVSLRSLETCSAFPATIRSSSWRAWPALSLTFPLIFLLLLSTLLRTPIPAPFTSDMRMTARRTGPRAANARSTPQDTAAPSQNSVNAGREKQDQADDGKPEQRLDGESDDRQHSPEDQQAE